MQSPLQPHWKAVKRILRYLRGTMNFGLFLHRSPTLNITGFCDSDWGNDTEDRRSTSGMCVYLGENLVTWSSKKQPTVSRSSAEAEFKSLATTTAEILWLKSLLGELKSTGNRTPVIWCDNLSAVFLSANPVQNSQTKHMELDLYFVREKVIEKTLRVQHLPSQDQIADIHTKPLSQGFFITLRN